MEKKPQKRSIGVFDSGLGGLSCVKVLRTLLPHEDILYLGDTGRVPYGSRSPETIRRYAADDIAFIESMGVKLTVAACATVSSALQASYLSQLSVPFMGVIEATAKQASTISQGKVGVIGTSATIKSDAFAQHLHRLRPDLRVTSVACPLFVPIVENGFFQQDNPIAIQAVKHYLADLQEVDTLILGCTHYPLLAPIIQDQLPNTRLVDAGAETAKAIAEKLTKENLRKEEGMGTLRCFVSDGVEQFATNAQLFLGKNQPFTTEYISIENLGSF